MGLPGLHGQLMPMREGIGLLAASLRIPIVPVHIDGAHEILPKGAHLPRHQTARSVRIRFGTPLEFGPDATMEEGTSQVGRAIEALSR